MRQEINILLNAILFYSRIRVPEWVVCTEETLSKAYRYFPLVGLIVGGVGAFVLWLSSRVLSVEVSVALAMVTMTLLTGAFHEDGLADFADGFGAGANKESILRIMKDSHIGTYGVLTLILASLLKFALISSIGGVETILCGVICAQGVSRFVAVVMLSVTPYLRSERSKATHAALGVDVRSLLIAAVCGGVALLWQDWRVAALYVAVAAVLIYTLRGYVMRKIGGCTGDVLGAVQQIAEILFYLTMIIASQI